jgi:hypothetical protein
MLLLAAAATANAICPFNAHAAVSKKPAAYVLLPLQMPSAPSSCMLLVACT